MRRISSRATFINKRVFPLVWFGVLAVLVVISLSAMIKEGRIQAFFLLVPALMAVFGYIIMKKLVFDFSVILPSQIPPELH